MLVENKAKNNPITIIKELLNIIPKNTTAIVKHQNNKTLCMDLIKTQMSV